MKRINSKLILHITIPMLALLTTACTNPSVFETIDSVEKRLGDKLFIEDELATVNYRRLDNAFRKGDTNSIKLNVYQLEALAADPVKHVRDRATQFNIKSEQIFFPDGDNVTEKDLGSLPPEVTGLGVIGEQYELAYNRINGAELLIDRKRFHAGKGIDPGKVSPDKFYVEHSGSYLKKNLAQNTADVRLYNYKIRHYMDALAKEGATPSITVSQVAVAYNTAVDGLAVIGPGSKISIHMSPAGEVVSHETTVRRTAKKIAELSAKDLLAPEEGRKTVEGRLRERGISLENYTLSRAEFGYYRRGRNSVQEVLAPYYAYFYMPKPDLQYARKLVEVVPAVSNNKVLAIISKDEQQELDRKKLLIGDSVTDDKRPSEEETRKGGQ